MAGVTYKCPNCGAYLAFDPSGQEWKCDSCDSQFSEKELLPKGEEFARKAEQEQPPEEAPQSPEPSAQEPSASGQESGEVVYHCPSCGSEIMTDATTVATHCYYCHNPVVLQGKLTAGMKPDQVLPFAIDKKEAVKKFMDWVRKKRFVPKDFFVQQAVEAMSGVYYPHFVTECQMDASYQGQGQNISTMDTPTHIVTKTDYYSFRRQARLQFKNVMRPALKSVSRKLSDGIHPFPLAEVKPFSSAYLSGFLAERRDIDASEIAGDIQQELTSYVKPLLSQSVHYTTYSGTVDAKMLTQEARYVLLPTWVLTYQGHKDRKGQPYYYVMNGRTGTVCGKLPLDQGKLFGFGLLVGGLVFGALAVLSYFLW